MFQEVESLKPLEKAAHIIANRGDWPALYDVERLNANTVPVASATYQEVRARKTHFLTSLCIRSCVPLMCAPSSTQTEVSNPAGC